MSKGLDMSKPEPKRTVTLLRRLGHGLVVSAASSALTLSFFLVLPLLQAISQTPSADTLIRDLDSAALPPPPPPVEEEPEEEEKPPEEKPPELEEAAEPLDLSQLELALDPGLGGDGMGGDFAVKLTNVAPGGKDGEDVDALFSLADLDQKPRAVYQSSPVMTKELRKKAPGTVYVLFVVDQSGKVENPLVQSSTDPSFERPALAAVKQWKFEPGKRSGKAVRFRMRVPITFPHES